MTNTVPGAAANAAVNVAALGGNPKLVGIAGDDPNGRTLIRDLTLAGVECTHVVSDSSFSTTTKVRVLAGQHYAARQQVIRVDYENTGPISEESKAKLRESLANAAEGADAIIVSDYDYGVVFPEIFEDACSISRARGIPLVVDSRFRLAERKNATSATPNRDEVEQILGKNFTVGDCAELRERLGLTALLVTNGNEGMVLYEKDCQPFQIDVVGSKEPVDVTGAGDTVIAAYALGLASGLSFADAANVANYAGGLVVMKKGTASVSPEEVIDSLDGDTEPRASTQAK
ncbi:hypothetical protein BH10ACI2_BH10ACI2_17670 [soil metagenome]